MKAPAMFVIKDASDNRLDSNDYLSDVEFIHVVQFFFLRDYRC